MGIGRAVKSLFGRGKSKFARSARGRIPHKVSSFEGVSDAGAYASELGLNLTSAGPLQAFTRLKGSFILGAAGPAIKAGVAYGVSSGLGEIADQTDNSLIGAAAGLGSFWAGTIGFRQALRAPLRGARAKWGYRRDALGGSVRKLSSVYDKYMYAPENIIGKGLKGGMKGFGRAMIGTGKGPYASRVPLLLRPAHGALGIGRAFVGGSLDRLRYAGRVISQGSKAKTLPGITGRMMTVRHPFAGALGVGMLYGGMRSINRHEAGRIGDTYYSPNPTGGINPRNWGGGVTIMNARGGVQHRMGSDRMAQRMARGRR